MEPPFEQHANITKLKEAAALLRFQRPDLAKEIECAIDDLEEFRERGQSAKEGE